MVAFSVEDRGIGIPSNQRVRVFQPFVRLLVSESPGSGIGLTIIQRIADLYGGKVWINDAEVGGCIVQFTVPGYQEIGGCLERQDAFVEGARFGRYSQVKDPL